MRFLVINKHFNSARRVVIDAAGKGDSFFLHFLPGLGVDETRRGLFDYFLISPLYRTLPLGEPDYIPVFVSDYLDFYVPWLVDEFFYN